MKLEDLIWWQNYQHAAMTRYKATRDPSERLALLKIADASSDVIVRMGRAIADESRKTLARMDAEDTAEVLS